MARDGGREPQFNEDFEMDVKYYGDDFTMRIYNKNSIMNDDLLGEATIKISGLCMPDCDDWWKVQLNGKDGGAIHFKAEWCPKETAAEKELDEKEEEIARLKQEMEQQKMQQQA